MMEKTQNNQSHMSAAPCFKTENLSKRVVEWIEQCILDGVFTVGAELPSEQEICNLLGVGKSSVREALKMLQMIGVVDIQQGKRSRIANSVNPDMMTQMLFHLMMVEAAPEELYEFRVIFETSVAKYALEHISEDGIQRLSDEVDRHHRLCLEHKASPEDEFVFHKLLYEACSNAYICRIGQLLLNLFTGPMRKMKDYDSSRDAEEHRQIVDALIKKDPVMLNRALERSFKIYANSLHLQKHNS